jgi:ubiquinone biosynthesis monooxygenase Coq7
MGRTPPLAIGRLRSTRAMGCARALCTGTPSPVIDLPRVRHELFQQWSSAEASSASGRAPRQAMYCTFTLADAERSYERHGAAWHWLDREMSSNFAGETGAVSIYHGALAAMTCRAAVGLPLPPAAHAFASEHMAAEARHLQLLEYVVPPSKRTRLLPIWRLSGWALGFAPTLLGGAPALYRTVASVEAFVVKHYSDQIGPLEATGGAPELVRLLTHCCADEAHHRDDALERLRTGRGGEPPAGIGATAVWAAWDWIVRTGSEVAAAAARRI